MSVPSSPIRRFEMRGGAWLMSIVLCAVLVVLSLGIVASPLRAIAAPAPVLIAYDAAVGPTSTTIQARAKTQHDSTPERGASTPTHCDGSALLGYDAVSNARMTASAEAGRAGGGEIDLADERENGVAATICDALAATTAAEGLEAAVRYTALDVGPLPAAIANTFRGGSYTATTLGDAMTLYRAYGGTAGQLGSFWTRTAPAGSLQATIDLALNPAWGNTASQVARISVPAGTTIFEGAAAGQGALLGGGSQVFIPGVSASWLLP